MSNHKFLTLSQPIMINDVPTREITLRSLKVRDLVAVNRAGGDEFERSINLLAAATDLDRNIIDEIDMGDLPMLTDALEDLLGKSASPASGKSS